MLRLQTFGGLTLTFGLKDRPQPRRRLAVLARLAAAGTLGVSRDELLALFWPDRDLESARHSLDQLLYEARRSLGASPTIGTAQLRLDPLVVACDIGEWASALERSEFEAAVKLYRGPFLHGFYLSGSAEFERWLETERAALAADHRRALEALATSASDEGRVTDAVRWWRRLATEDRYGSRTALGLMRTLVEGGDRAGALEFARVHERIVGEELEAAPDPAVTAFADSLRAVPGRSSDVRPPAMGRKADELRTSVAYASTSATAGSSPPRQARRSRLNSRPVVVAAIIACGVLVAVAVSYGAAARAHAHTVVSVRTPVPTRFVAATRTRLPSSHVETASIAAHDFYERGRDVTLLRSDSGVRVAIEYLERAVALDTNYAAAYAALASRYATFAFGATIPISERRVLRSRAEAAARRAVALDDSLAAGHAELGYTLVTGFDPVAGAAELERATALDPEGGSTPELFDALPLSYEWLGQPVAAVTAAQRLLRKDSLSPAAHAELGHALYFARRYNEALGEFAKLASIRPQLRRVPEYIAQVYAAEGRWSDAVAVLRPSGDGPRRYHGLLGYVLARSGRREEAKRMLTSMLADESAGLVPAWAIAEVYIGLGDYDRAFVWLDRSFDDYSLGVVVMAPIFDDFRADPRFERAKKRLHLTGM